MLEFVNDLVVKITYVQPAALYSEELSSLGRACEIVLWELVRFPWNIERQISSS